MQHLTTPKGNDERYTHPVHIATAPLPTTCPWIHTHTTWPCRDSLCLAGLPHGTPFAHQHLIFFVIYHLIFLFYFLVLQAAEVSPAARIVENNKKIKNKKESEGKHKTERWLNIPQSERERIKPQQWVAKAKSIELGDPSNTSLCLRTI